VQALGRSRPIASAECGGELVSLAPPVPATSRLSATWRESGEAAAFLAGAAAMGEESAAVRRSAKRVWRAIERRPEG